MDQKTNTGQDQTMSRIRQLTGDVGSPGTLRRQIADLSTEFCDYGVVIAIDQATNGEWMPPAVRYKYAHFFTHWTILATMRLADPHRDGTSIPVLVKRLRSLRQQGEMSRDRWIERLVGVTQWRKAREAEEQERLERLMANPGRTIWSPIGSGAKAARLNEVWNLLTGREKGTDGHDDVMEEWILDSAECPLKSPQVRAVQEWRDTTVAHQDMRQTRVGSTGYDVFPMRPLVRAYWAVLKAAHRVLLLAEGVGLHGLLPTPQFSVANELSGGKLAPRQTKIIDDRLMAHSLKWERLLQQTEQRWYDKLNQSRRTGSHRK